MRIVSQQKFHATFFKEISSTYVIILELVLGVLLTKDFRLILRGWGFRTNTSLFL